ncbi:MAG: HIT family protein [uncultured bacterium]|nr:MAG: HIT family protein [uncultured bacterium]
MEKCIFCKIIKKEIPSSIVLENDKIFAFNDINPVSPNHILVIPKRHIDSITDSCESDKEILGELLLSARDIAKKLKISDYRLVINNGREVGQSVFHVHVHLLGGRFFSWPPG